MMSSEEDVTVDSFGLPKKTKRSRQRVDAGEPRNSYSSIPNFSSRPNLLNAGIYGTFFGAAAAAIQQNHQQQQFFSAHQQQNQNQQQSGFGPSKMLNDLIARSIKTINPSLDRHQLHSHHPLNHHPQHRMMTVEPVGPAAADISIMSYEQQQQQTSSSTTTSLADMATHHMLRNILQSRNKKELFALEQELRAVSAAAAAANPTANDGNEASNLAVTGNYNNNNNNYYRNNNNNNNNNTNNNLNKIGSNNNDERLKSANFAENGVSEASSVVLDGGAADERRSLVNGELDDEPSEENEEDEEMDVGNEEDCQASAKVAPSPTAPMLQEESNCNKSSDELESDSEIPSPRSKDDGNNNIANGNNCKEDGISGIAVAAVAGEKQQQQVADSTELKKARVENIVSGMRSSPSHVVQVNGCKKRKLYHPQQHDNKDSGRDKTIEDNLLLSEEEDEEEEEEEEEDVDEEEANLSPNIEEIREKVAEKNALKHQLRTMQEKLKQMQDRYNRLQKSHEDCAAVDDGNDMTIAADEDEEDLEDRSDRQSPPGKEPQCASVTTTPTTANLNPIGIGKMLSSSKLLPQQQSPAAQQQPPPPQTAVANIAHQMNLHPGTFNGTAALSFLRHQMFQEQQAVHHHPSAASLDHNHFNAARHNPATLGNAAAAMYLGVSQKLLLEQEARLAKEAALMAAEHQFAQTHHHRNYHHQNIHHPNGHHHRQSRQQQQQQQQHHDSQHNSDVAPPAQPQQQPQREQSPNCKGRHRQSSSPALFSSEEKLKTAVNSNTTDLLLGFVDTLKSRIPLIVPNLIEEILAQYLEEQQQLRPTSSVGKSENETKDSGSCATAATILDRKSPRTKVIDRGSNVNGANSTTDKTSSTSKHHHCSSENNNNVLLRPSPPAANSYHQPLPVMPSKMMSNGIGLYPSMNNLTAAASHLNPFCLTEMRDGANVPEQNEALSLVVMPKKKRHKVTDTRITPRTVNRILSQDNNCPAPSSSSSASLLESPSKYGNLMASMNLNNGSSDSPPPPPPPIPRSYHLPVVPPVSAPVLPVSLPTSVAIPNPGLHESQVFSPYGSFYAPGQHLPTSSHHLSGSSRTTSPTNAIASINDHLRPAADSPPPPPSLPHHSAALFHPALLAAAAAQQQHHHQQQQQQQPHSSSPDYLNMRSNSGGGLGCGTDSIDRTSDCNSVDGGPYDAMTPILATLTPMHLRKAKLMFFWVRYPSSAVLKTYFPDIRFNKGNTAQLVKWFSNFREFYYIQMEKYARQAVAEEKSIEDLVVSRDDEIYRVLNLHYNRNNHIEVPPNFRYVIEQTLKEFYKAILTKKDAEQSWKKAIYKVISRLDDPVPEYFKSPNFLEQLE